MPFGTVSVYLYLIRNYFIEEHTEEVDMSEMDEIDANIDDFLTTDDHEEIELSTDEEPDITPEVSLVVLK